MFFLNLATSPHCPKGMANTNYLKYEVSLVEIRKLDQYISMRSALEEAQHRDSQADIDEMRKR